METELPPGRFVHGDEGSDPEPALWVSDGPAPAGLWAGLRAGHARTGRWPLLLDHLWGEPRRPWDDGELWPGRMSSPDDFYPGAVLGDFWNRVEKGESAWPGLAGRFAARADPDELADRCAAEMLLDRPHLRLGLVEAGRGADALTVAGWDGPVNHENDTAMYSAVLRSWEDRFGVRVIGVGFATLDVSVAAPPSTPEEALRLAAEHFAFCPDTAATTDDYADRLLDAPTWHFWWD